MTLNNQICIYNKVKAETALTFSSPSLWMRIVKCNVAPSPGEGTLGISGWGCATGTLEPLAYTRASSAEFCYPILVKSKLSKFPHLSTLEADLHKFKLADLIFYICFRVAAPGFLSLDKIFN